MLAIAPFAGATGFEDLAKAVEAVARVSRSSEGMEDSAVLARIDREQLALLRKTFGPDAARTVAGLRVRSVLAPGPGVAPGDDLLADILRAEPDVAQLGSMGLAGALRQAQQYYSGRGSPLPDAVKVILSITFPRDLLESVRVVDTGAETNLPAIINEVQTTFGEAAGGQSAVTIDSIIAFSELPALSSVDFWAHEIQHVVQYRQLGGIDAFAGAYTRNYRQLEDEANNVARKAVIDAQAVLMVIHALNPGNP